MKQYIIEFTFGMLPKYYANSKGKTFDGIMVYNVLEAEKFNDILACMDWLTNNEKTLKEYYPHHKLSIAEI